MTSLIPPKIAHFIRILMVQLFLLQQVAYASPNLSKESLAARSQLLSEEGTPELKAEWTGLYELLKGDGVEDSSEAEELMLELSPILTTALESPREIKKDNVERVVGLLNHASLRVRLTAQLILSILSVERLAQAHLSDEALAKAREQSENNLIYARDPLELIDLAQLPPDAHERLMQHIRENDVEQLDEFEMSLVIPQSGSDETGFEPLIHLIQQVEQLHQSAKQTLEVLQRDIEEHPSHSIKTLSNHVEVFELPLPDTNRMVSVYIDPPTLKAMRQFPQGVTAIFFGSQALEMVRGSQGGIASTGKLIGSDIDLYAINHSDALTDREMQRPLEDHYPDHEIDWVNDSLT